MQLPKGKKIQAKMSIENILKIFSSVSNMCIKLSANDLILFEVYGENNKLKIQEFIGEDILSNKSKPLIFSVNLTGIERGVISFYIYQQNAIADYIEKVTHVNRMPYELFVLLKPIQVERINNTMFDLLYQKLEQDNKKLKEELLLLDEDALKGYLKGSWSGGIQKKQVVYTYEYYRSQYDSSVECIEDGEQRKKAEKQNQEVKSFLDLCRSISKKYDFILGWSQVEFQLGFYKIIIINQIIIKKAKTSFLTRLLSLKNNAHAIIAQNISPALFIVVASDAFR